jgi:hypothetical protein
VVGAIADLDVNTILDGLRAPYGPRMGHWIFRGGTRPLHDRRGAAAGATAVAAGRARAPAGKAAGGAADLDDCLVAPGAALGGSWRAADLRQQGQGAGAEGEDLFAAAS